MELRQFVTQVLLDIVGGISDAQEKIKGRGAVSPELRPFQGMGTGGIGQWKEQVDAGGRPVHMVEFDVAITAEQQTGTKGGVGVVAGVFALGSQGQSAAQSGSVSRVKFTVPVRLPTGGSGQ